MITCSCKLCIYQEDSVCTLDCIEIDASGMCLSGIYVNLDDSEIERQKKIQRERLDELDALEQ